MHAPDWFKCSKQSVPTLIQPIEGVHFYCLNRFRSRYCGLFDLSFDLALNQSPRQSLPLNLSQLPAHSLSQTLKPPPQPAPAWATASDRYKAQVRVKPCSEKKAWISSIVLKPVEVYLYISHAPLIQYCLNFVHLVEKEKQNKNMHNIEMCNNFRSLL